MDCTDQAAQRRASLLQPPSMQPSSMQMLHLKPVLPEMLMVPLQSLSRQRLSTLPLPLLSSPRFRMFFKT